MMKRLLTIIGLMFPLTLPLAAQQYPPYIFLDANLNPYPSGSGSALGSNPPYALCYTNVSGQPLPCNFGGSGPSFAYPIGTGFTIVTGGAAWGTTLADPLPVAHGGTGSATAGTALSNLGGAPLASPTFTGTVTAPTITSGTALALSSAAATNITISPGTTGVTTLSSAPSTSGSYSFISNNTFATSGSNYNGVGLFLAPNVSNGAIVQLSFGVANSAKNVAAFNYQYEGSDSSSSTVSLSFFGTSNVWQCTPLLACTFGGAIKPPAARKGTFICTSAGTILVNNANYLITSDVIISTNTPGGTQTYAPNITAQSTGVSFSVTCATADTSTYNYTILN